jgi:phosphohistidine phosphatase
MKTLILIRHAKSSWKHEGLEDWERPLNGRGRRDAPIMAERFSCLQYKPSLMVSSHATRALTTARVFARYLGYPVERLQLSERIYEARAEGVLDFVGSLPEQHQCVALFGHNPGFTDVINALTSEDIVNLPTSAVAVIELPIENWQQVEEVVQCRSGKMVYFSGPKQASGLVGEHRQ